MTDRYDEIRVPPDPLLAEALRQRLHERMATVSVDDRGGHADPSLDLALLEPEHPASTRAMYLSSPPPMSLSRDRSRIATAVATVAAVVGLTGIALASMNESSDDDGVPEPVAAETVAPTTIAPGREIGSFAGGGDDVPVTFTVPDGWYSFEGWTVIKIGAHPSIGVSFFDLGNLYADPCRWVPVDPPVGPTVDDLVSAWASLPGFVATEAVDVTVDGYVGKQIELTVPDYDGIECKQGKFALWQEHGRVGDGWSPSFWAQGPEQLNRQSIVDVDGTRLVISAGYFPDTSPKDRAAIEEILASIQIG